MRIEGVLMKRWKCSICGQIIEDTMGNGVPPKEHGVLIVRLYQPAVHKVCKGMLEEMKEIEEL